MTVPLPPLPVEDLDHVLVHTAKIWPLAKEGSFFITGGTGFFGIWLLESFARANDDLGLGMRAVVLTRDPAAFFRKAPHLATRHDLIFHPGELRTFVFPEGKFTHIIHAAADTGVWTKRDSAGDLIDRIAEGMQHLLDFAVKSGASRFLHVSSGAVYGRQPAELLQLPEDHAGLDVPLSPSEAWAEGKRVAERLCLSHATQCGYTLTIARGFTFVGPHLDGHYAISSFIGDVLHGSPIQVNSDGTPDRSYLYASDLAIWLWTILLKGSAGRSYNVGSPEGICLKQVAQVVAAESGESLAVEIKGIPTSEQPVSRYVPATKRAENELGLQVWIPLPEAIRKTIAWQRSAKSVLSL